MSFHCRVGTTAVLEVGVDMPNAVSYAPLCDTGVSIEAPPIVASVLGDDKVNVFSSRQSSRDQNPGRGIDELEKTSSSIHTLSKLIHSFI